MYLSGMSISQVAKETGVSKSTARRKLKPLGILRTFADGTRLAASQGRLSANKGVKRAPMTDEQKRKISVAKMGVGKGTVKNLADGLSTQWGRIKAGQSTL